MDKEKLKNLTKDKLIEELGSSTNGLSESEVHQKLLKYGPNTLKEKSKTSIFKLLLRQFSSSLIYLLLVAGVISFLLKDYNDGFVITAILIINTGLSFYQAFKSEKAVEKLQELVTKKILVIRSGEEALIDEKSLVIGDLVILREGDVVAADIRITSDDDFSVNESQLTGESAPVIKTSKGDCLVYAGSTVEQGEAYGYVYATALNTELGKIAHLSTSTVRVTQYEKSLSAFSAFLVRITFLTLLAVFIFKIVIDHDASHLSTLALFIIALSIAVVPEAMPVIATVTLSRGALNLAKHHVIAKTLTAVEDLGNINVLCSDKTGTLTENRMTVKRLVADDSRLFQTLAVSSIETHDQKHIKSFGSFDKAILDFAPDEIKEAAKAYKRLDELPFDPVARRRRVVFSDGHKTYLVVIGSAETLLDLTTDHKKEEYLNDIKQDGLIGLRHLAFAYKEVKFSDDAKFDILKSEASGDLIFAGFVSLEDPLRPSAKRTIKLAKKLGVAIKILSGDSHEVTQYVAGEVGLLDKAKEQIVYTGDDIDKMSDTKLSEVVNNNNAFARLNPEQKFRIIKLLKLKGNVVGYQGDGINDAPALKEADVAIAVNNATDVAQESADILLLRNDLHVIVNGIKYGRGIFSNINKYIRYTMIGNFGNFFALSTLFLLSTSLPLLTLQLLLTNLLGDVPLIAISTDNVDVDELNRPSKYNMHSLVFVSIVLGTYTALFEIIFYAIVKSYSLPVSRTSLFVYLTIIGLVVILSVRNKEHFWKAPPLSKTLRIAFGIITLLTLAVVYFGPTQHIFSFVSLPLKSLGLIAIMTILYFSFLDLIKIWFYKTVSTQSL